MPKIERCRMCSRYGRVDRLGHCGPCAYDLRNPHRLWRKYGMSDTELGPLGPGVYIVHAVGTGYYKIGKAGNALDRFLALRTASPAELRVIRFFETEETKELETGLHGVFAAHRRRGSEWFLLPHGDVTFLMKASVKGLFVRIDKRPPKNEKSLSYKRPTHSVVAGVCVICGGKFKGRAGEKYCTVECRLEKNRKRAASAYVSTGPYARATQCDICGVAFSAKNTRHRICSPACREFHPDTPAPRQIAQEAC
jgi:predicted nucleic acid-binding Zn ribbon protein